MQSLQIHNKELYFGIFLMLSFLVFAALGPGLYSELAVQVNSWQYLIFEVICHQDPVRSYSISGIKMAVCSRCLGIYAFILAGWLTMPLYSKISIFSLITEKRWLIASILLNLTDLLGNYLGIWTNTLLSRFLLGGFFGYCLTVILANEFFTLNKSE